jgi:hypothetical protein
MKDVSKRWIQAAVELEREPRKEVLCPACGVAALTVTDIEAEGVVVERKLQCSDCFAVSYLRLGPSNRIARGARALGPLAVVSWSTDDPGWVAHELSAAEDHTRPEPGELDRSARRHGHASIVWERLTAVFAISGSHTSEPMADVAARVVEEVGWQGVDGRSPADYVGGFIDVVVEAARRRPMHNCLVGMALCVLVSDDLGYLWRVGSNGIWVGPPTQLRSIGTDHRKAALVRAGKASPSPIQTPLARLTEEVSGVFHLQTPDACEAQLVTMRPGDVVLLLNKGAQPFGPLPSEAITAAALFQRDAGWKHGLRSHGVAVTRSAGQQTGWPGSVRILRGGNLE